MKRQRDFTILPSNETITGLQRRCHKMVDSQQGWGHAVVLCLILPSVMPTTAQPPAPTLSKSGKQPLIKKKLGNISVAVFSEEVSSKDGEVFIAYNFSLQKSWKDQEGNWQNHSISLKRREILQVQAALGEAFVASYLADPDSAEEQ